MEIDILTLDKQIKEEIEQGDLPFYISDTICIIESYKKLLKIPKKINFMGKVEKDNSIDTRMTLIVDEYVKVSSEYKYIHTDNVTEVKCSSCGHDIDMKNATDESISVCDHCSSEQGVGMMLSSFSDSSRVHISSKYSYDRKSHFIECINQYQGKQNVVIQEQLIADIFSKLQSYDLLVHNNVVKRYSKVTKKAILSIIKELGHPKHYENINLIFSKVTGSELIDICHIQDNILNDFDILSDTYDKLFGDIERKNFINTQYILYQLLRKHGHDCNSSDFSGVKTIDRKFFHEDVIRRIFEHLGWNYYSIM